MPRVGSLEPLHSLPATYPSGGDTRRDCAALAEFFAMVHDGVPPPARSGHPWPVGCGAVLLPRRQHQRDRLQSLPLGGGFSDSILRWMPVGLWMRRFLRSRRCFGPSTSSPQREPFCHPPPCGSPMSVTPVLCWVFEPMPPGAAAFVMLTHRCSAERSIPV